MRPAAIYKAHLVPQLVAEEMGTILKTTGRAVSGCKLYPSLVSSFSAHQKNAVTQGRLCTHWGPVGSRASMSYARNSSNSRDSAYGHDRYQDQFRPSVTRPYSRPDQSRYNYSANRQSDYRKGNATASVGGSNYGQKSYGWNSNGRGDSSHSWSTKSGRVHLQNSKKYDTAALGAHLRPVDWSSKKLVPFQKDFYKEHPAVAARTLPEIRKLLSEHEITITGKQPVPKPLATFAEASLPDYITQTLMNSKITSPTSIQKIGLPVALSGRDLVGVSRTGSGKTLAFSIPAMLHIEAQPPLLKDDGPIVVVLAPTRELTMQIHSEIEKLGRGRGIRSVPVFGGASKYHQVNELRRGAEIIVGCPGRLLDLLVDQATNFSRTTYLVLDEADRMLDMGFEPQIRKIVSQIRPDRQTLMYSATWPQRVETLARDFCRGDTVTVKVGSMELHANSDIQQDVVVCSAAEKFAKFSQWLTTTLQGGSNHKILVFCSRKKICDQLSMDLHYKGLGAVALHGDKSQNERDWAVQAFRSGQKPVLVATDVAARGLDIHQITAVANFDLPGSVEDYVHRIGRTGRAGHKGLAVTFFAKDDHSSDTARMASGISLIMQRAGHTPPADLKALARYY